MPTLFWGQATQVGVARPESGRNLHGGFVPSSFGGIDCRHWLKLTKVFSPGMWRDGSILNRSGSWVRA